MPNNSFQFDLARSNTEHAISDAMFGVNVVASKNYFASDGNLTDVLAHLGSTAIRYPGGTVTEQYFDPAGTVWRDLFERRETSTFASDGERLEGPGPLFDYAAATGQSIQFVLPTADIVSTQNGRVVVSQSKIEKIKELVTDILEGRFGEVTIDQFEIGNEYYYYADLTAEEYGAVAKAMVLAVDDAINDYIADQNPGSGWDAPKIAVQAGAGWRNSDNETILDALDGNALDRVDSVIFHYYPSDLDAVDQKSRHLGQIDEWRDATGRPDIEYFVSEWNVFLGNNVDEGLAQASTLIAAFAEMNALGVDTASVWGTQFRWLDIGLTSNIGELNETSTQTRLSAAGEVIASLKEATIGLKAFDVEFDSLSNSNIRDQDIDVTGFGDDGSAVIYLASRSNETINFRLDLDAYFGDVTHVWGEIMSTSDDPLTTWADESGPRTPHGLPDFETLNGADLGQADSIRLDPYEILRISVKTDGTGVVIADHNPLGDTNADNDDTLIGSQAADRITAHIGDDTLFGRGGSDGLRAGSGDDSIFGGAGDDVIFGEDGDDQLIGGDGYDLIIGGAGNDQIFGNEETDIISGGDGDDVIFGGQGDDVLAGGSGTDVVTGGLGSDYFVASRGGTLTLDDFDFDAGEKITFLGQFADADDLRSNATVVAETGDLIISDNNGGQTVFLGAGDQIERLIEQNQDFTVSGQRALELSNNLNTMNRSQIDTFFGDLDVGTFFQNFAGSDPVILFANLNADTAGLVLNAIPAPMVYSLLDLIGKDGLVISLGGYSAEEVVDFFDITSGLTARNLVSILGEHKVQSLLDGMSQNDKGRLEPKLIAQETAVVAPLNSRDPMFALNPGKTFNGSAKAESHSGTGKSDLITGGGGSDTLRGGTSADKMWGDDGGDRILGEKGKDILFGGNGADRLVGGQGSDGMFGGASSDQLWGGKGQDVLIGNNGNDRLFGGDGQDTLKAGNGNDRLSGGFGDDKLLGSGGRDKMLGQDGDDTLSGGAGRDDLNGGKGRDTLYGGEGADVIAGGKDDDVLEGNKGNDKLYGNEGADRILGASGADLLVGGKGDDSLFSGSGDDVVKGGRGSDLLDGGGGNDTLFGGDGADVFVFRAQGADTIADFELSEDVLALSPAEFVSTASHGGTLLTFENGSTLYLTDVTLGDFNAALPVFDLG